MPEEPEFNLPELMTSAAVANLIAGLAVGGAFAAITAVGTDDPAVIGIAFATGFSIGFLKGGPLFAAGVTRIVRLLAPLAPGAPKAADKAAELRRQLTLIQRAVEAAKDTPGKAINALRQIHGQFGSEGVRNAIKNIIDNVDGKKVCDILKAAQAAVAVTAVTLGPVDVEKIIVEELGHLETTCP